MARLEPADIIRQLSGIELRARAVAMSSGDAVRSRVYDVMRPVRKAIAAIPGDRGGAAALLREAVEAAAGGALVGDDESAERFAHLAQDIDRLADELAARETAEPDGDATEEPDVGGEGK